MKKNKVLLIGGILLAMILVVSMLFTVVTLRNRQGTNDAAEKDITGRYITIINNTEQVINEVHITVGNGTEIEEMQQKNKDEKSFSIKIPKQYDEYTDFTIILIDRYNMRYEKEISNVAPKGRTEAVIDKDNYVEQKGDFWNKIDKFFNGDL